MNSPFHSQSQIRPGASTWVRRLAGLLTACLGVLAVGAAPALVTDHDAYHIGEPIAASFSGGPGNKLDWVGVYPEGIIPSGNPPSTIWKYVDNTQGGATGFSEGTVTFPGGLNFAGPWTAFFLLNDGYEILAQTTFNVVDPSASLVRSNKRKYVTGEAITITFTNGPANPKDWIGIYKEGEIPDGDPASTAYLYVDGTQGGAAGVANGSVTFATGLANAGNYVAFFLLNDGYDVLASEAFTVEAPSGAPPRVIAVSPANGAANGAPLANYSATLQQGSAPIALDSIELKLDGAKVTHQAAPSADKVIVTYGASAVLPPGSPHTYTLIFADTAGARATNEVTFTIGSYENIVLPAPIVFENFDAVAEGGLPAGWTSKSYTDQTGSSPDLDLGNLDSASYANWVVVNVDRFNGSFVTYSNPDNPESWETDYRRVLTPNPINVVNGQVITGPLATGRMVFGDSGYRNGSGQVLFLFTPDFDLTGKTNVHLVFHSLWEQNQDSIAAVEYSVDAGATWLPVAYFLATGDIIRTEAGDVDAEATLNAEQGDTARYTDENGTELGTTYGSFIAAPVSAALAPFIQGRVDDNASESKRVEKYRLAQADGTQKVRFRFAHAGTDSWYWGLDNFGLYSISEAVEPAVLTITLNGDHVTISSNRAGTLEVSPSLTNPQWSPIGNGISTTMPITADARFFRMQ
jgi:hypothetical protein